MSNPMSTPVSFESFHLPPQVYRAIKDLCFESPTVIQQKAIPLILEGKDVVGQAETGSGKTAAFGLPLLGKINGPGIQMLVLTPTRELCNQVMQSLQSFSRHLTIRAISVFGGVGMSPQIHGLRKANIVVACPGRLLDLMRQGVVDFRRLKFLIIDEADRMFDMGFIDDVEKIIRHVPLERQTLLFSATMPGQVRSIVQRHMKSPVFVETQSRVDKGKLREFFYEIPQEDKFSLLVHLLKNETPGIALVFCGTRRTVERVAKNLQKNGVDALPIHGGLSQVRRDQAMEAAHKKRTAVLVATDIAARGLHIKDISHVYNFDLPTVPEDYTHRIGRTARAGAEGDAITLLSSRDYNLQRQILRIGHTMTRKLIPAFERVVLQRPQEGRFHARFGNRKQNPSNSRGFHQPSAGSPAHGHRGFRKPHPQGHGDSAYHNSPNYEAKQSTSPINPSHPINTTHRNPYARQEEKREGQPQQSKGNPLKGRFFRRRRSYQSWRK